MKFDWDVYNEEHIAAHQVEPYEAEDAFCGPRRGGAPAYVSAQGEKRQAFTGKTQAGRLLTVVVTRRGDAIRIVTARERGKYRRA